MATITVPRSDIQVTGCGSDDQRLYSELDEEFYGFENVETLSTASTVAVEDSDEEEADTCSNDGFDITTAISEATCSEVDDPSFLLSVDDEKIAIHAKFESGCGCPHDCYKHFSEEEVYHFRLQMIELEKGERDMLILGKLMVCGRTADSVSHARAVSATKRQRITYEYSYDHQVVCKSVFCFMHVIGEKVLKNLQSHL